MASEKASSDKTGSDKARKIVEGFKTRLGANRNALLAFGSCVHCGMCADSCHYYLSTGDPKMTPAYKADQVRKLYKRHVDWMGRVAPFWVGGKTWKTDADLEAVKEIVYGSCTLCRRCTVNCPFGIDKALIMRIGRSLITAQGVAPDGITHVMKDQWEVGNQMGITKEDYLDTIAWLEEELQGEMGPEAKIPIDREGAEIMYVVNPREVKYAPMSLVAAAKIFHVAGASWTMPSVGWDNTNFGLFSGDDKLGGHMGKLAYDQAMKLGVKRMVISECGHGFRSTKWEAPNWAAMDLPFPIVSLLEVMCDYVNQGKIVLDPAKNPDPVTYHDPCNLSRSCGVTEEPRFLLKRSCMDFREMTPNRQDSFCCTGGGGAMSMSEYAPRRLKTAKVKADQISATGARAVATACHNCVDGLTDLIKHYKLEGVAVKNVCEFVADSIVLPEAVQKAVPKAREDLKDRRILVCDDEPDIVDFLTTFLTDEGFRTSSARSGEECIEKASRDKPDLITLDITMPGKSGVAVFTELRRNPATRDIPVFIISGRMDFRQVIYHREVEPPEGYMEKPINRDVLLMTVRKILEISAAHRKKAS